MDLSKVSILQLAATIGAAGTIIGAVITIDTRYAKHTDVAEIKKELKISIDKLHQQILENEQLKEQLGNNAQAAKVLAERNRQELAEIRARLSVERYKAYKDKVIVPTKKEVVEESN